MHIVRPGFVWRPPTNLRAADDQHRLAARRPRFLNGGGTGNRIMTIYRPDDIPAIGPETCWRIVTEPALDMAVDRDAVVVPERNQFAQTERTG